MAKEKEEKLLQAGFTFKQLVYKDGQWLIKLSIGDLLPETLMLCKIKFILDEKEYEERIAEEQSTIQRLQENPELYEENYKQRMKVAEKDYAEAKKELEQARQDFPPFTFVGVVQEVKFNHSDRVTTAVFAVEAEAAKDYIASDMNMNMRKFYVELLPAEVK